jgi:uncharacterized protein YjbI with pentapeptide repeats
VEQVLRVIVPPPVSYAVAFDAENTRQILDETRLPHCRSELPLSLDLSGFSRRSKAVSSAEEPQRSSTGEVRATQAMLASLCARHNDNAPPRHGRPSTTVVNWDFSGLDFRSMQFSDAAFLDCTFRHADMRDSAFQRSKLWGAAFDDADMSGGDFGESDFSASGGSSRRASRFTRALLRDTNLDHAVLTNAEFDCALLDRTKLRGADLAGARFRGAEIIDIALDGLALASADFAGASLRGTMRAKLEATGASRMAEQPSIEELEKRLRAHEIWVRSGGRSGRRLELVGHDLAGRDFSRALLAAARFDRSIFVEVCFRGAMLAAAQLRGANLRGADFTAADLRGADLRGANLRDARLGEALTGLLPGTSLVTLLTH